MCGIVGMAGNVITADLKAFRDMLLMDVVRGQDSTGVLAVPVNLQKDLIIEKDLGHPMNLWDWGADTKTFDIRGVANGSYKALIGHNRATTKGATTIDNAHPFTYGDITGVHNGTLWNTDKFEGDDEVDSKQLYKTIAAKGIDYTWENLNGAAALAWWDDAEGHINLIRNSQRTLYMCFNKARSVVYWASEWWMLVGALSRNNIDRAVDENGVNIPPVLLKEDNLYSFKINATSFELKEDRKLKKATYSHKSGTGNNNGSAGAANGYTVGYKTPNKPVNPKTRINLGWAEGLARADKDVRGMEVELMYPVQMALGKEWSFYIVGKVVGTQARIEIFPDSVAEYQKWETRVNEARPKKLIVQVNARPRLNDVKLAPQTKYKCSTKNIKLVRHEGNKSNLIDIVEARRAQKEKEMKAPTVVEEPTYPGFKGERLTVTQFHDRLSRAGQCCAACDTVLHLADAEDILWLKPNVVMCDSCSSDQALKDYVERNYG